MPASGKDLLDLLDLDEVGTDSFLGQAAPRSRMVRTYGGHLLAQALMAAYRTVPSGRPVHSLHASFLRGGDAKEPVRYDVTHVRDGRSFTSRRVVGEQHGRQIFELTASFHRDEAGYEHQAPMPHVPAPRDAVPLVDALEGVDVDAKSFWREEWKALDLRVVQECEAAAQAAKNGTVAGGPPQPSRERLWFRVHDSLDSQEVALNSCLLAYMSDLTLLSTALRPHGYPFLAPEVQRATVNHTMWFHEIVPADQWMLYDKSSDWAGGSRGLATAQVYSPIRGMVATVAQEGLIRPHGVYSAQPAPVRTLPAS
ncbi:acyl-CoA thioesterase [Streptomyces brevispora]|uniref:Thioesterase family protein n=1 Tax=Streptomyces brevispora TaxID=887462 RepID=A0ABZ1G9K8_9ACTN|nr:acyl-CoA thioesterase domain-containing protein [Streptomyces brevispora]WSC15946.1 thioesterase family protein [Streptomyces brevispora]